MLRIIKAWSGIQALLCEECGGLEWTGEIISANKDGLSTFLVIPNQRGDPTKQLYTTSTTNFSSFEKQDFYTPIEGKPSNITARYPEKPQN